MRSTPMGNVFRIPGLRQLLVGNVTRIYIEVVPEREFIWPGVASSSAWSREPVVPYS